MRRKLRPLKSVKKEIEMGTKKYLREEIKSKEITLILQEILLKRNKNAVITITDLVDILEAASMLDYGDYTRLQNEINAQEGRK